jgi:MFS transporter, MHS family, shikimate and dehydroshikimate transport protein
MTNQQTEGVATRTTDGSQLRRVAAASFIGSLVEWYDFFLYGIATALVFGPLFFPSSSDLASTLSAFATFAVGFFARPVGGVIFGHVGDRIGRKAALVITLLTMGTATFLVGLLPTAEQIGVWAPAALVALRLLQGIAVGGEWGGATLLMFEHAPAERRGFFGSIPQTASSAGLMLATGLLYMLDGTLSEADFQAWGWRVPFLMSVLLVAVGIFIRIRVPESPEFEGLKREDALSKRPVVEAMGTQYTSIARVIGMRITGNATGYLVSVFALEYVTGDLGVASSVGLLATMLAAAVQFVLTPLYGRLSDRIGRKPIYLFGATFLVLFAYPFFLLVQTGNAVLVVIAFVVAYAVANGALFAMEPSYFSELFGTRVRYSGISLAYQFSAVIAGGLAPFIAAWLVAVNDGEPWLVAAYWVLISVITLVATILTPETRGARAPAAQRSDLPEPATSGAGRIAPR